MIDTLFTLVDKLCPAIVGASFGVMLFSDKLVLSPDTATIDEPVAVAVPTVDVRELLAIVGASFATTVPADKLDEVPVTAIV